MSPPLPERRASWLAPRLALPVQGFAAGLCRAVRNLAGQDRHRLQTYSRHNFSATNVNVLGMPMSSIL